MIFFSLKEERRYLQILFITLTFGRAIPFAKRKLKGYKNPKTKLYENCKLINNMYYDSY